jgi:hypothetical protein
MRVEGLFRILGVRFRAKGQRLRVVGFKVKGVVSNFRIVSLESWV